MLRGKGKQSALFFSVNFVYTIILRCTIEVDRFYMTNKELKPTMKRMLAILMILCALCALTGCTDGPLVATATPAPTPTPTPEPTPEPTPTPYYVENVVWPETSITKLLPHFQPTLEVASQQGDEFFFAAFSEPDNGVINRYLSQLQEELGFTVSTDAATGMVIATGEVDGNKLKVQFYYDGGYGTIQINNESAKAK